MFFAMSKYIFLQQVKSNKVIISKLSSLLLACNKYRLTSWGECLIILANLKHRLHGHLLWLVNKYFQLFNKFCLFQSILQKDCYFFQ